MKRIIAYTLAVLAAIIVVGQNRSDTVNVYFHISRSYFDPALGDNAASMDSFIDKVRAAADTHNLDRIVIRAYASPDGPERFNQRLSVERCDAIASLIVDRAGISPDLIEAIPEGVAWVELRRLVAETPDVPSRERILDIIDNTPIYVFDSKGNIITGRKKQLMDLRGGRPYKWLLDNIFPKLRNALAVSLYLKPTGEPAASAEPVKDSNDLKDFKDLNDLSALTPADSVQTEAPDSVAEAVSEVEVKDSHTPRHLFALKTNFLYYPALLPNIEGEWLINDNWSVALESNVAWWGQYSHKKSYRLVILDAEARRWIKPRAPWHGMYVGVLAGGGWYDFQNGGNGKYGEGLMTGLTFGYMWPIGRNLSLEAEVGAGYAYTRYKEYEPFEGHHIYLRTKQVNYFGPIKLKFSIAWRFYDINKPKRISPQL